MAIFPRFLALSLLLLPSVLAQVREAQGPSPVATLAATNTGPATAYSTAKGTKFMLDGTNFRRFGGINAFYLTKQPRPDPDAQPPRPDFVKDALIAMKDNGVQVVRVWGHLILSSPDATTLPGENDIWLQRFIPGERDDAGVKQGTWEFNDDANTGFGRLDHVINTADSLGMRIIVVLGNYFNGADNPPGQANGDGGLVDYHKYFGNPDILDDGQTPDQPDVVNFKGRDSFFAPPVAPATMNRMQEAYRAYVEKVVNRYKDDLSAKSKAIFSYELMNEPRCGNCETPADVTRWVKETSDFIKIELGDKHMVGVGDEGFFNSQEGGLAPPGTTEAQLEGLRTGGDVTVNGRAGVATPDLMALASISYGSIHYYPETPFDPAVARNPRSMAALARQLGKPVVVGEYSVNDFNAERLSVIQSYQAVHRETSVAPELILSPTCTGDIECPAEIAAEFYWQYGDEWTLGSTSTDLRTIYSSGANATAFGDLLGKQAELLFTGIVTPPKLKKRDGAFIKNRLSAE